jgi:RHS repeat-associated protein
LGQSDEKPFRPSDVAEPIRVFILDYVAYERRVVQNLSSSSVIYVYDAFGQLAAEYHSAAAATPQCSTCYLSPDWLGSTRLVTDPAGTIISRHDFTPFGQEVPGGTAGRDSSWGRTDDVRPKFTGQLRDTETGMDYFMARYYGNALGRFVSPDPANAGADPTDPQTWNGYAYVRNNPLAFTDPSGLCTPQNGSSYCFDGGTTAQACRWWQVWCWIGSGASSGGTPEDLYQQSFLFGFIPVTNGGGSGGGGGGGGSSANTTAPKATPNPTTSGTRPCVAVDPKDLDYITPRLYRSENRIVSPAIHIKEGHIQPVNEPKNSYYLFGNPITGISDPMATMAQVVMINRATFSLGTAAVQQNTNISFKLTLPPVSIDMGFGILSRYGIGKSASGRWLSTNTLIIDKNCTSVVTSFPSNP